ncbi:MAG: hypothetical protein B7Z81_02555 [Acidocella sp. 20-61-6]|nr:MAG: hypothetical protein B7Z81_02555 [Acidocella sp. 20-61-6]
MNGASKQPLFKKSGAKIFVGWAVPVAGPAPITQLIKVFLLLFLQKKKRLPFPVLSLLPA